MFDIGYQTLNDWWKACAEPWLLARNPRVSWELGTNDIFVVPTRGLAKRLQRLIAGMPLPVFGVDVYTPRELRSALFDYVGLSSGGLAVEDLTCIAEYIEAQELPGHPIIRQSTAKHSQHWIAALTHLKAAGAHLPGAWADLDQKLIEVLGRGDALLPVDQDVRLRQIIKTYHDRPIFNSVFFWGFEAHCFACPNWLEAVCKVSTAVRVSIPDLPEDFPGQLGYSFCEGLLGEAQIIESAQQIPLFNSQRRLCEYTFLNTIEQEAEAICRTVASYLNEPSCENIAIVLGREGPLSRLIAYKLQSCGISFCDGIGASFDPVERSQQALRAWASWAQRPTIPSTKAFIRQWRALGLIDAQIAQFFLSHLHKASSQTLTTHFGVVANYLKSTSTVAWPIVLEPWPQQSHWAQYIELLKKLLPAFGIAQWSGSIEQRAKTLSSCLQKPIALKSFLAWATKALTMPHVNGMQGGPWARVQLLSFKDACGQSFSHLIMAGLNREDWEGVIDCETIDEGILAEHGAAAVDTGKHGAGDYSLKPQKFWILKERERSACFKKSFLNLIEQATERKNLFFSITNPEDPNVHRYPSVCLAEVYEMDNPMPLLESEVLAQLCTLQFRDDHAPADDRCRIAFEHRRNPKKPFDEYSFAFREAPEGGVVLTCRSWEEALKDPGGVWFRQILRIEPERSAHFRLNKALTQGLWVHDWLQLTKAGCVPTEELKNWSASAAVKAKESFTTVQLAYRSQGLGLPLRWLQAWHEAHGWAHQFLHKLRPQLQGAYGWMTQEITVPLKGLAVTDFLKNFPTRGRLDLLLSTQDLSDLAALQTAQLHVIDFKVNDQQVLSLKTFEKNGYGLQLVLYGKILQSLQPQSVGLSIISTKTPVLDEPQLMLEGLPDGDPLWAALTQWQRSGVFGLMGAIRDPYKPYKCYPLATLEIPTHVSVRKWALTHPGLESAR